MLRFTLIMFFFIISSNSFVFSDEKVLKLVYKDIGKPPYMQVAPDNSGLYFDMMQRAAEKIGFRLKVVRLPKIRTYMYLKTGRADLHASGEFRDYRSKYLYYFSNGLYRKENYYGLTSIEIPELTSIPEINKYNLSWIVELGSSWPLQAEAFGVKYSEVKKTDIDMAIKYIRHGRSVFFRVIKKDLEEYMVKKNITSMEDLGVRVHKNACKTHTSPLYVGFSRFSPHYKEEPNLQYDKNKPLSPENFPFKLVPGSVPHKLQNAFKEMIDSGEINSLKKNILLN